MGFVAGVYRYTYAAMKTVRTVGTPQIGIDCTRLTHTQRGFSLRFLQNELEELSAELDDVRKAQQALQSTAAQHAPVAK